MPGVSIDFPIRWGDMDALGHVNNTVFFRMCEDARIAYFRAIDLDRLRPAPQFGPGLVAANLNFRRQLKYPCTAKVTANVTTQSEKSFTLSYTIRDADAVAADGTSVNVWVDYSIPRAMKLPPELVEAIRRVEES